MTAYEAYTRAAEVCERHIAYLRAHKDWDGNVTGPDFNAGEILTANDLRDAILALRDALGKDTDDVARDAARYRWLRSNQSMRQYVFDGNRCLMSGVSLDRAIDAAMSKEGKSEQG